MPDITTTFQTITPRYQTLIDMVSHELKSPLTTIKIFAEVLQKEPDSAASQSNSQYLNKIDAKVNYLSALINDFNDIVKIKEGKTEFTNELFDYPVLLASVLDKIKKQRSFNYKTENVVNCRLSVDAARFQQVLSKFIFHLLDRLNTQNNNIQILSGSDSSGLLVNILNPTRSISVKDYQLLPPTSPVDFYDDIEVTLADTIVKHYQGSTQLFLHPEYGYIFSLTLPVTK